MWSRSFNSNGQGQGHAYFYYEHLQNSSMLHKHTCVCMHRCRHTYITYAHIHTISWKLLWSRGSQHTRFISYGRACRGSGFGSETHPKFISVPCSFALDVLRKMKTWQMRSSYRQLISSNSGWDFKYGQASIADFLVIADWTGNGAENSTGFENSESNGHLIFCEYVD